MFFQFIGYLVFAGLLGLGLYQVVNFLSKSNKG